MSKGKKWMACGERRGKMDDLVRTVILYFFVA